MDTKNNYLIQSNFFNESVLSGISEIQKDILYYLQTIIDFRETSPTGKVTFNYEGFLKYKKMERNNSFSPKELSNFTNDLRSLNGVIYNKNTDKIEFFNIIDKVEISPDDPNNFGVSFASWGKIFYYEKFAKEYAENSKIAYTQIEKNIIDLGSDKRKKFFELLSQYKHTGVYKVSLKKLKMWLGFIIYDFSEQENKETQLTLFDEEKPILKEFFKTWYEFKRNFLEPAISEINKNKKLDIDNLKYIPIKKGTKVVSLEFHFKKRLQKESLTEQQLKLLSYLISFELNETQAIFLMQRLSLEDIYKRLNEALTFNNHFDNKESQNYRRKVWFENQNNTEIKNLGGFLYSNVFPELQND